MLHYTPKKHQTAACTVGLQQASWSIIGQNFPKRQTLQATSRKQHAGETRPHKQLHMTTCEPNTFCWHGRSRWANTEENLKPNPTSLVTGWHNPPPTRHVEFKAGAVCTSDTRNPLSRCKRTSMISCTSMKTARPLVGHRQQRQTSAACTVFMTQNTSHASSLSSQLLQLQLLLTFPAKLLRKPSHE